MILISDQQIRGGKEYFTVEIDGTVIKECKLATGVGVRRYGLTLMEPSSRGGISTQVFPGARRTVIPKSSVRRMRDSRASFDHVA